MLELSVQYESAVSLVQHAESQGNNSTLLLPWDAAAQPATQIEQFDPELLHVTFEEEPNAQPAALQAEVLQLIPNVGLVVRLLDQDAISTLAVRDVPGPVYETDIDIAPPELGADDDSAERSDTHPSAPLKGTTALSWTAEKLQAEWHTLPMPEKVRLARYGKRHARAVVLKTHEKVLHSFLLVNPKITADEVAVLASRVNIDMELLKRIASAPEWTRHTSIARNLVSHPKLPLQLVRKVMGTLGRDELRQLSRSGKVRASVKRLIVAKLDRGK